MPQCLLARVEQGRIYLTGESVPPALGGRDRHVVDLSGEIAKAEGGAPAMAECGCGERPSVLLSPEPGGAGPSVALNGPVSLPKKLQQQDPASAVYQQAARQLLDSHGMSKAPVRLTHILRTDLEGAGVDEVLYAGAWNQMVQMVTDADPAVGAYAFLALRRVVAGQVETVLVESAFVPEPPSGDEGAPSYVASLAPVALLDLDGDGIVELVLELTAWEYGGYALYSFREDEFLYLTECGCGC